MRQRQLDHVQGSCEVCFELVADVEFILVFAGADDAVAGAVCDYVDSAEVRDCLVYHAFYGLACSYVAEESDAVGGFELFHCCGAVLVCASDGCY